jgi:alpha-N-arabinofuranosidase
MPITAKKRNRMKKTAFLYAALSLVTAACFVLLALPSCRRVGNGGNQPLSGGKWGEVRNGSAEDIISDGVAYWNSNRWEGDPMPFYDDVAHSGTKSLCISSSVPSSGEWINKVNLKPWSVYRFVGWIKTSGVASRMGGGAGFTLTNVDVTPKVFVGDNDWTKVAYQFETRANDCTTIICQLGLDGLASGRVWFDDVSFELLSSEKLSPNVRIDTSSRGTEMSQYIYGQFIEHLGRCIYGGIWAEMVMDRKFWYAPESRESPWKVSGGDASSLYMDESCPYTGSHAPVLVSKGEGVTLEQESLGMKAGVAVSGHIVLKSSVPMDVVVKLVSSGGTDSVKLTSGTAYKEFPLHFGALKETDRDVTLSIGPLSAGKLWVGTVTLMPDDNVQGFRSDVLALLKGLNAPVYRWPGGNFVSGYDWKDGIGPRDRRPPRKNPAWSGVENNDVGIHEFMALCSLIGTEPYIAVNAGLGGVQAAAQEVEYCNGSAETPMGRLRASNGHPDPWKVGWWSIGNEMFGDWQLGHMSTAAFVEKHNSFASAMKGVDSTIKLIGVGNVGPWDEMILSHCQDNMDYVSEHFYCQDWNGCGLMTHASQISQNIKRIADAHRKYRDSIPGLSGHDIRICMDEWNYWYGPHIYGELGTRYYLRDALGIAEGLNEYLRNSDIIYMANYAQTVNVIGAIKTTTTDACYAATGEVLKTYRAHFGTVPVSLAGDSRPLDVAASLTSDGKALTISVVNPTYDAVPLKLALVSGGMLSGGTAYSISAPSDMSYNTPGLPPMVTTVESPGVSSGRIVVPAFSAVVYVFPM